MRNRAINRKVPALGGRHFRDSITFSDKELETMSDQDVTAFLNAKAQQYAAFLTAQSSLVTVEPELLIDEDVE